MKVNRTMIIAVYSIAAKNKIVQILRDGKITSLSCEGGVAYGITVVNTEIYKAISVLELNKEKLSDFSDLDYKVLVNENGEKVL